MERKKYKQILRGNFKNLNKFIFLINERRRMPFSKVKLMAIIESRAAGNV